MRPGPVSSSILVMAAAALVSSAGCSSGSMAPADDLAAARARWNRTAPAAYTYTIRRSCECLAESSGPVSVAVRNGTVVSRRYTPSGVAVTAQYAGIFPAVDGLFAIIETAIRDGTRPLRVEYHPTFGYPTRIALGDPAVDAPLYIVTDFLPGLSP